MRHAIRTGAVTGLLAAAAYGAEPAFAPPFGQPEHRVDLTAKAHEAWRLKGTPGWRKIEAAYPPDLPERRARLWEALLDRTRPLTADEVRELKAVVYYDWTLLDRDDHAYDPDAPCDLAIPAWGRYRFTRWYDPARDALRLFELDPRKEYLDWAIAYCDMLLAWKAGPEDRLVDAASGRAITCWPDGYVQYKDPQARWADRYPDCLGEIEALKAKDPAAHAARMERMKAHLHLTVTTMMSGYMAAVVAHAAEAIYRHPELYDERVPDFQLPLRKDTGATYRAKADAFFKAALESMEFFSTNPAYWDDARGLFMDPRGVFRYFHNEPDEAVARRADPWNRVFARLRAQAHLVRLMQALDARTYAPILARYKTQISRNLDAWKRNRVAVETRRGTSSYWNYDWIDYDEPGKRNASEDLGHALATIWNAEWIHHLGVIDTLTDEDLRTVAITLLDTPSLPAYQEYASHVKPRDPASRSGGVDSLVRTLPLTRYHRDFFPVVARAVLSHKTLGRRESGIQSWLFLVRAKTDYVAMRPGWDREDRASANRPPVITGAPAAPLLIREETAPGTPLTVIRGQDPDPGQTLRYWIVDGNLDETFSLDPRTGRFALSEKARPNADVAARYDVKVVAEDNGSPPRHAEATVQIVIQPNPGDARTGLLLAYDFEGADGNPVRDGSGNGYDGEVALRRGNGVPAAFVEGRNGGQALRIFHSLQFPPPFVDRLARSDAFTIAFWVKQDAVAPDVPYLIGFTEQDRILMRIWVNKSSRGMVWDCSQYVVTPMPDPLPGGWNHWAFIRDKATDTVSIYFNGDPLARSRGGKSLAALKRLHLGNPSWGGSIEARVLVDDLKIYGRALRRWDVETLYREPAGRKQ